MNQRMCDYLTAVIEDLNGKGLDVTDIGTVTERLANYWAEVGETLYVVAVMADG